ncbi:MAG: glucose 1-dehydrogenase [Ancalomicrobiaceae bacterium]|nr:glucose 1-dehydrogenase [Ancalomicrobiaceae bacterium]
MAIMDKFSMQGKVSVVTGGSNGIGLAIAEGLAEAGSAIVIAARDGARNTAVAEDLRRKTGVKVIAVTTDVASRDDIERLSETAIAEFGQIDVLINSAGIGFHADALKLPDADWDRLFSINLEGMWKACQIVGRHMVGRGKGSIVNIGSISGFIINRPQWHSPYGISKAAVHHLTRSLAAEWATAGVRVNAIAPGYVKTGIASTEYEDYRHYWRDEVPMRRYARADEIAPTALLLASDASSFTTGSVFVVDGGYTLW